ncbi:MAG: hypothetical protein ABW277_21045 [Longimicrobiaceae bacterium]
MEILSTILLVLAAGAALYLRYRDGGDTGSRPAGATVIRAPSLGVLNLQGEVARSLVDEDREAVGPLFCSAEESDGEVPRCDVLLVYCAVGGDGRIAGSERGLRELIRDSGAQVVVVGSPNEPEAYFAAAEQKGYGHSNLVMTLDRKGGAFPGFFRRLFSAMFEGASMPVAWARLAPQHAHAHAPETIFAAERGQVTFAR